MICAHCGHDRLLLSGRICDPCWEKIEQSIKPAVDHALTHYHGGAPSDSRLRSLTSTAAWQFQADPNQVHRSARNRLGIHAPQRISRR